MQATRTVFYVSDGTGITAEMLGHSLLAQFEGVQFKQVRIPFVDTHDKAVACLGEVRAAAESDAARPIVITTIVDALIVEQLRAEDVLLFDLFETFIGPLEMELGMQSVHLVGRGHGMDSVQSYMRRMEAVNFALAHDDGISDDGLDHANVILVGVSRSGKTPTSLYLALQFGVKAANYPLIPEDFERMRLPSSLANHRAKLFGLTIDPGRLHQIRNERRPDSRYASLENCRFEVEQAQRLMRRESIRFLDSTRKSIEELAATIMQEAGLRSPAF